MTVLQKLLTSLFLFSILFNEAIASDSAFSARGSCEVSLGYAEEGDNGLQARGGTTILKCPLTKNFGTSENSTVYARISRASMDKAKPFCFLVSTPPYGTSQDVSYGYAGDYEGSQSINMSLPTLYLTGYLDLYCVLNNQDILFGVRYVQAE